MPTVERRRIIPRARTVRPLTREEAVIESLSPLMNVMVRAVRGAGRSVLRDFGELSNLQIVEKAPGDFVSRTDKYVEKYLIETLTAAYPSSGIICEEGGKISAQKGCPYTWIIDPIDGTINFVHAIPHFAISVALKQKDDVVAGVIFNPVTNELYYAEKGKGAFVLLPSGGERLRVSGRTQLQQALIGSNGFYQKEDYALVSRLSGKISSLRLGGCISLGLAGVASGKLEAYVTTQFNPWDIAAGMLLVKEAGGTFVSLQGDYTFEDILKQRTLIAVNPDLKEKLLQALH